MVCFTKYDPLIPAGLTSNELVFLQPVEYNSYFAGACISWRRVANGGAWQPHYRITDHLGSTRLETSFNGTITAAYDYKPFGEQIPLMITKTRKTYIGKERDEESYLGDFGVRKYDYAAGRFTSPDVLWEKYMGWSPYHYCRNNPIARFDANGMDDGAFGSWLQVGPIIKQDLKASGSKLEVETIQDIVNTSDQPAHNQIINNWADIGLMGLTGMAVEALATTKAAQMAGNLFKEFVSDGKAASKVTRSLDDIGSLRGAKMKEVENLIPDNWIKSPMRKGNGFRFHDPLNKGDMIMLEKGWPGASDPLHSGPYMRYSRSGEVIRIPLKGNPTL